ncbi:plasmid transfer protein [Desertivirga xinjiangensis]|uniref:plasmid transfer protein n=1 Tax=Desertivirga xinjiangensis TaxID=539206 RepID=UPI0021098105|nr:plasmid transfer protein [Pedobacter xinjiangensis]
MNLTLESLTGVAGFFLNQPSVAASDSYKDTFSFLQGGTVYEEGMMYFLRAMKETVWTHYDSFIADAQALAAIFMLIYFGIRSYEMIAGDKKLEVMPLLRPFGLAMIIIWWGSFIKLVALPTDLVAAQTEEMFEDSQSDVDALRLERAKLMAELADQLFKVQAETEVAKHEADTWYENAWESVKSSVKEGFADVWNPIIDLRNRMQISLQLFATSLLETIALWILRICVYFIFIIQIIFSTILIILGPFSVAVSILPAFRDSFTAWIARFVSVNLYSGIAFLVLYVSSLLQHYAMEAEITRYKELVDTTGASMEKLGAFASNGIFSFGIVIGTFIIGALTMLTVPSISTWVISTSGISSAVSSFSRGATNLTRIGAKMMK